MKDEVPAAVAEEPLVGNYFVSAYPPFSCWNEAAVESFRRELRTPRSSSEGAPLGLYVHIPFCVKRCQYCYYLSYDDRSDRVDRYLEALVRELRLYVQTPALTGRPLSFVYFGGGTPSLLSDSRIATLTRSMQELLPWTGAREVTFECAPKTVTEPKLRALREAGVTRISLGAQQLDDHVLEASGRIHKVHEIERAYAAIREVGFDIVNIDLMVGMVGETEKTFLDSLARIVELAPESVTIYQLEIPLNTPLYRAMQDGALPSAPASWKVKRARLTKGFDELERSGYVLRSAYTAVRADLPGDFVYQDAQYHGADIIGIGVSSFSYFGSVHQQNLASLDRYLESTERGKLPLCRAYALSDEERMVREFVLQLKLGTIETAYFRDKFGVDVTARFAEPIGQATANGWIRVEDDAVRLTREGLLNADRMLRAFYLPEHRVTRYS